MDGVLCHYDFDQRLAKLADITDLEAGEIDAAIFQSGFDDRADRGHYTAEAYLREFGERLGVPVSRHDWVQARGQAMKPDHDMIALVRRVAQLVPVAMMTNNGALLQENLAAVFPEAAALFGDRAFFSSQFNSTKEEPDVFHAILKTLSGDPASTLFVDDSETYIASAQTAGLCTHHFAGIAALTEILRSHNLY